MPGVWFRAPLSAVTAAISAVVLTSAGAAADSSGEHGDSSNVHPSHVNFGGDEPERTSRTVRHWSGQAVNGLDGLTYSFKMVGVDPSTEASATIGVDILPLNLNVAGMTFKGSESVAGVVGSPLFQAGDYSSTPATAVGSVGPGGDLSAGNTGVQLLDATMRSEFNKVGTGYHLILGAPVVHRPITINVPADQSLLRTSPVGVVVATVDETWFQARVENQIQRHDLEPSRLAMFLTKNVLLYADHDPTHCCGVGGHGAAKGTGGDEGQVNGKGNHPVQTFVWSSWLTPGFFGPGMWVMRDIVGLSHEITEWANDPFNTNIVQPWTTPNAPQYACSNLLETGDPTFAVGFAAGTNTFDQNPWSDGYYHVQDEALLPWFMRTVPNTTSQATQVASQFGGRYTFMGSLNPLPWFRQPAIPC